MENTALFAWSTNFNQLNLFRKINKIQIFKSAVGGSNQLKTKFVSTSKYDFWNSRQIYLHLHIRRFILSCISTGFGCAVGKHRWRSALLQPTPLVFEIENTTLFARSISFNQLNLSRKINKLQKFKSAIGDSNQLKRYPCPSASMAREISVRTFFSCTHVVWPSHASTPASIAKALPDLHSRNASLTKRTFCSRHHWLARWKTPLHSLEQSVSVN